MNHVYAESFNQYIGNGMTPLMTASFEGHVNIVKLLVEAKAHINIQREEV